MKQIAVSLTAVTLLLFANFKGFAAESYAGYGSEPTSSDHVGEKEYSPYLNIG